MERRHRETRRIWRLSNAIVNIKILILSNITLKVVCPRAGDVHLHVSSTWVYTVSEHTLSIKKHANRDVTSLDQAISLTHHSFAKHRAAALPSADFVWKA